MQSISFDKKTLINLYIEKDMTIQDIANLYNVNRATISRKMKELGIPTANKKPIISGYRNKDEFARVYEESNYDLKTLAKHLGISYALAHHWLQVHKFQKPELEPWKNKKLLEIAYCGQSTIDLAKQWGCSVTNIRNWLNHFKIPLRRPGMPRIPDYRFESPANNQMQAKDEKSIGEDLDDVYIKDYTPTFPPKIKIGNVTYKKLTGKYSLETMYAEINNGEEFIFAEWWPSHTIKGNYSEIVPEPDSFNNNLDIYRPNYFVKNGKIAVYAISIYTEVNCVFRAQDMKEMKDGWRMNFEAEFCVYRK